VKFWPVPAVKLNPDPVVWAALTGTLVGEHVKLVEPLSFTTLAVPVAVLLVTPLVEDTVQLTSV